MTKASEMPQQVFSDSVQVDLAKTIQKVPLPKDFIRGQKVLFNRANTVLEHTIGEDGFRIRLKTRPYWNMLVQTHETAMNQYRDARDTGCEEVLELNVTLVAGSILRVTTRCESVPIVTYDLPDAVSMVDPGMNLARVHSTCIYENESIVLHGESITVIYDLKTLTLSVKNAKGRRCFSQRRNDLFTSDIHELSHAAIGSRHLFSDSVCLGTHERIVGLGERFDAVKRNGRPVDFRNKDAIGTSSPRTYINVPFYISSEGYGLFLNSSGNIEWDFGISDFSAINISAIDTSLEYYIICGDTPAAILDGYTSITGKAPVPPVWSFGTWFSRNSYVSWDVVDDVVKNLNEKQIPFDVVHLDTAWFEEDWNCDLKFSNSRFSDPESHMKRLMDQGVHVSLWQYNFIPPRSDNSNYLEAKEKGYLVTDAEGDIYSYPEGVVGSWIDDTIIDFSNPEAVQWYAEQISRLISMGASAIKVDFGEGVPDDGIYKNIDGHMFHNLYSLVYNHLIANATHAVSDEWIIWARSGTAGSQRYPLHWGGDSQCSFSGLEGTIKGMISAGISGLPFLSHDIGGYIGRPTEELYIRWAQVGLLSSHARTHGCGDDNSREPWSFGQKAYEVFKEFSELRYRLFPYIMETARAASNTGLPVVRSMLFDSPQDRQCWDIEDQYFFGPSLLVCPILQPLEQKNTREVYLPEGEWYDYWTKDKLVSNGAWYSFDVSIERLPLFVKAGSVIPYTDKRLRTMNEEGEVTLLEIYGGIGKFSYEHDERGIEITITQDGYSVDRCDYEQVLIKEYR